MIGRGAAKPFSVQERPRCDCSPITDEGDSALTVGAERLDAVSIESGQRGRGGVAEVVVAAAGDHGLAGLEP